MAIYYCYLEVEENNTTYYLYCLNERMVDLQEEVKEEIYNLIDSFEWDLEVKELVYQHVIGNYEY